MKDKDTTLTPLSLVRALGEFDYDPCGYIGHKTAKELNVLPSDGLSTEWKGRVWLNPPYSEPSPWLKRMSEHGRGVAIVLASTETEWFQRYVFGTATSILFLKGRPKFLRTDLTEVHLMRGVVLVSWGETLNGYSLVGTLIQLKETQKK